MVKTERGASLVALLSVLALSLLTVLGIRAYDQAQTRADFQTWCLGVGGQAQTLDEGQTWVCLRHGETVVRP